jgi:gas vesicle protein
MKKKPDYIQVKKHETTLVRISKDSYAYVTKYAKKIKKNRPDTIDAICKEHKDIMQEWNDFICNPEGK